MAAGTVLRYAGATIAILILVYWFMSYNPYRTFSIVDELDSDLIHISDMANEACASDAYEARYVPELDTGTVTLSDDAVCIDVTATSPSGERKIRRCAPLQCSLYEHRTYNLENTSGIWIRG